MMIDHDALPEPEVPEAQRGTGTLALRYDDVTQDGRMRCEPITHAIGAALWRTKLMTHPMVAALAADGIVPILSRVRIAAGGGPIGVRATVDCRSAFEVIRTIDPSGRVRWRLDMWAETIGARGRTYGAVEREGEPVRLGRVIAEHVLTRPFAAPERRSVDAIPGGLPADVPVRDVAWSAPASAMDVPEGATSVDAEAVIDPCTTVLGIGHTDSNQHVNSLVYPRLLEEAALRRFAALGMETRVIARGMDIAFRKPCFAGDRVRVVVRALRGRNETGIVAAIVPEGDDTSIARAHCYARLVFTA